METEIEVKFALDHLANVRERVLSRGGRLLADRTLERSERFDLADGSLAKAGTVLRLREATSTHITYKRPTDDDLVREEVSIEILDSDQGRAFLRSLGYQVVSRYEKYRETFQLGACQIMLDELPFGCFLEIEGPDRQTLMQAASSLGLDWEARVRRSYLDLFESLASRLADAPSQATFQAFQDFDGDAGALLGLQNALAAEADKTT